MALQSDGDDVVRAQQGGDIILSGGTVTANSTTGRGLVAVDAGSTITASNGTVITTLGNTGADISAGASLIFNGANLQAAGADIDGVIVKDAASSFQSTNAIIDSAAGTGLRVNDGAAASLTGTTITAADNAIALNTTTTGTALVITGGSLQSTGSAILVGTGAHTLTLANGAQLQAGNNRLVDVADGATLATTIDNSDLTGRLFAAPTGTLDVVMRNTATFTGDVVNGNTFDLQSGATWFVTGNSDVQSLAHAGNVDFAGGGAFHT